LSGLEKGGVIAIAVVIPVAFIVAMAGLAAYLIRKRKNKQNMVLIDKAVVKKETPPMPKAQFEDERGNDDE
jgi:hypothetical protein